MVRRLHPVRDAGRLSAVLLGRAVYYLPKDHALAEDVQHPSGSAVVPSVNRYFEEADLRHGDAVGSQRHRRDQGASVLQRRRLGRHALA